MQYITFDAHKHYTLASVERPDGGLVREGRISREWGALRRFLRRCDRGSPVAVETVGNWDLDGGRDRSDRVRPQAGPRAQGEEWWSKCHSVKN
jgi:hypothetical protein